MTFLIACFAKSNFMLSQITANKALTNQCGILNPHIWKTMCNFIWRLSSYSKSSISLAYIIDWCNGSSTLFRYYSKVKSTYLRLWLSVSSTMRNYRSLLQFLSWAWWIKQYFLKIVWFPFQTLVPEFFLNTILYEYIAYIW